MMAQPTHCPAEVGPRCLVADDHAAIRCAVADMLRAAGVEVVGLACDGRELVEAIAQESVDLVVLDLRLAGADGIQLARWLASSVPKIAAIIHTSYVDPFTAQVAIDAGVRAVVLKRASSGALLSALDEIAAGRSYLDPELAAPSSH